MECYKEGKNHALIRVFTKRTGVPGREKDRDRLKKTLGWHRMVKQPKRRKKTE